MHFVDSSTHSISDSHATSGVVHMYSNAPKDIDKCVENVTKCLTQDFVVDLMTQIDDTSIDIKMIIANIVDLFQSTEPNAHGLTKNVKI